MAKEIDLSGFDEEVSKEQELDLSGFDEEVQSSQESEEPSMAESVGRGAVQGASLGLADEIGAALLAGPKKLYSEVAENIPGTPEFVDARLREQGFTGDIEQQDLLDEYRSLRDTAREADKAAQEASPYAYGAGQIAGAVLPTLALGGGGAAAAGTQVAGRGAGTLLKIGAQGLAEGAIAGAGESEADLTKGEVGEFAGDVGTSALLGAGAGVLLPVGAKMAGSAIKKGAQAAKGLVEATGDVLGISKPISAGYKIGKKGLPLDEDKISEALTEYSEDLILDIKKAMEKSGMKKSDVLKEIEGVTEALDAGRTIQEVIDQVKNSPRISQAADIDKLKTIKALEELKLKDPVNKAIARNERKLAKRLAQEERKGGEVLTTTDFEKEFDEILPLPETQGKVIGSEARVKYPEGDVKKIITTETDELFDGLKQLTGREIDLSNMNLKDIDLLLAQIKKRAGDITQPTEDPIEKAMRDLATRIKEQRAKILEGDPRFLEETAKQRSLYEALEATPLKKEKSPYSFGKLDEESFLETETSRLKKMLQQTGAGAKEDQSLMFKKLKRAAPEFEAKKEDLKVLQEGMELAQRDQSSGVFRSAQKATGILSNLVGRGAKRVGQTKPVQITKNIASMTNDQLQALSRLADSKAGELGKFSPILQEALANPDKKDVLLWTLSRQPAFREALRQAIPDFSEEDTNE